ncbi:NUDIX hydrolase [Candidatus Odyssella thessalonicensis]|uniref:NUDIX hydrolase n=1 Tax=Candidatus Odyssella thessalonicensis TaxID=84647 RepID=UPI000225B19E|nr:NUDIX domain-containing protein [Candidatus Odyssella thessalonicensis]
MHYTQMQLPWRSSIQRIYNIIANINPYDELEEEHKRETLEWIESGAPLFRIKKPDVPSKHLVCYFVLLDEEASQILLVDHKKAQLWLPSGGHVEIDEDPRETVKRECLEELDIEGQFWREAPLFLTVTQTVGLTAGHTDVSLWYILKGDNRCQYRFDPREFNNIKWFSLDNIPVNASDPHISRFVSKLQQSM